MKGEYKLNVAMPIDEAVQRVMKTPGARVYSEVPTSYLNYQKNISMVYEICLRQVSGSYIEFSESYGLKGINEIIGNCIFKSVSKNETQVTANFKFGTISIKGYKTAIYFCFPFIPVAA